MFESSVINKVFDGQHCSKGETAKGVQYLSGTARCKKQSTRKKKKKKKRSKRTP